MNNILKENFYIFIVNNILQIKFIFVYLYYSYILKVYKISKTILDDYFNYNNIEQTNNNVSGLNYSI